MSKHVVIVGSLRPTEHGGCQPENECTQGLEPYQQGLREELYSIIKDSNLNRYIFAQPCYFAWLVSSGQPVHADRRWQ